MTPRPQLTLTPDGKAEFKSQLNQASSALEPGYEQLRLVHHGFGSFTWDVKSA